MMKAFMVLILSVFFITGCEPMRHSRTTYVIPHRTYRPPVHQVPVHRPPVHSPVRVPTHRGPIRR